MNIFARHRTILTYGLFDGMTYENIRLLQDLSCLGTRLIVGCETDAYSLVRGAKPKLPYAQRRSLLEACRYVDQVIAETCWEQKRSDIVNYNADTLAVCGDWRGHLDDLEELAEIIYLPRTENAQDIASRQENERRRRVTR